MDDEEDVPDLLAAIDQGIAGLGSRAKIIKGYHGWKLLEVGFNEQQAFELTRDHAAKWPA